jgi:hypothetical protein
MKQITKQIVKMLNQQIADLKADNEAAKKAYLKAYNRRLKRVAQLTKMVDDFEAKNIPGHRAGVRRIMRAIQPPMRSA